MKGLTLNVAVATFVFFAITLVWRGAGDLSGVIFSSVVFALFYGAIQAALVIFRK